MQQLDPVLGQIFECLDYGKNTKALSLINKQLSKQPESAYFLSLKAVADSRLGNVNEASAICDKLINRPKPILDEIVLNSLGIALKELTDCTTF